MNGIECPHCGHVSPEDSLFCAKCGKKLNDDGKPTKGKKWLVITLCLVCVAAILAVALILSGTFSSDDDDDDDEDEDIEYTENQRDNKRDSRDLIHYSDNTVDNSPEQNIPSDNQSEDVDVNDYILDHYELTHEDLANLSKSQLRLLRNEIYARHGYIFKSKDLQDYFGSMPWYIGSISNQNDVPLNSTERKNIAMIQKYE